MPHLHPLGAGDQGAPEPRSGRRRAEGGGRVSAKGRGAGVGRKSQAGLPARLRPRGGTEHRTALSTSRPGLGRDPGADPGPARGSQDPAASRAARCALEAVGPGRPRAPPLWQAAARAPSGGARGGTPFPLAETQGRPSDPLVAPDACQRPLTWESMERPAPRARRSG